MAARASTVVVGLAVAACTTCAAPPVPAPVATRAPAHAVTTRPAGCREVGDDAALAAALADPAVAAICLRPGRYAGPLAIARAVTVWGPREAILHAEHPGSTVELRGKGAGLLGVTIDGRGGRFDQADAAVHVTADDSRVEDIAVTDAMFGIVVEQAARVRVVGNRIAGSNDPAIGLRGDTLRLWEAHDCVVTDNDFTDGRDAVIWYSDNNRIANNRVRRGRYGLHFMYSHHDVVERNRLEDGVVGIFAMYSRDLAIRDNTIANALGAGGMAIGLKESGDVTIAHNRLIHDATGLYLDASPLQIVDHVWIAGNDIRFADRAIVFHASGHRVAIEDNDLADNHVQVAVDGGGDALDVGWRGNYFDDYAGYDLDDDGTGDVPYELRSLAGALTSNHEQLALLDGTPALALVDAAAHLDPLYAPRPLLRDDAPRMSPHSSEAP